MSETSVPKFLTSYPEASIQDKLVYWLSHNWIYVFGTLYGTYVLLPFLAPAFMSIGWAPLGKIIYMIYSFLCHQLPERSYFLFGPKISYSLAEIQAAWQDSTNPAILRQFIGNPSMGWKIAWSDRMVSMFTSLWLFGLIWLPLRKRVKVLPLWAFMLFIIPVAFDGTSHLFSDMQGFSQGFRNSNLWLVTLTQNALPGSFYAGDSLGSFNSWMRILTGILFGIGIVWFTFPYIDAAFRENANFAAKKLEYARMQYQQFQALRNKQNRYERNKS